MLLVVCVGDMPYGDIIKRRIQINLDSYVRSIAVFIGVLVMKNDSGASAWMAWSVNSTLS